jgi:hypothetical protein
MALTQTYVVECSVCQQPWEVTRPLANVPGSAHIVVPQHGILDAKGEEALTPCGGGANPNAPGMPAGTRSEWEQRWSTRFIGRNRPAVKDGAGVEVVPL